MQSAVQTCWSEENILPYRTRLSHQLGLMFTSSSTCPPLWLLMEECSGGVGPGSEQRLALVGTPRLRTGFCKGGSQDRVKGEQTQACREKQGVIAGKEHEEWMAKYSLILDAILSEILCVPFCNTSLIIVWCSNILWHFYPSHCGIFFTNICSPYALPLCMSIWPPGQMVTAGWQVQGQVRRGRAAKNRTCLARILGCLARIEAMDNWEPPWHLNIPHTVDKLWESPLNWRDVVHTWAPNIQNMLCVSRLYALWQTNGFSVLLLCLYGGSLRGTNLTGAINSWTG